MLQGENVNIEEIKQKALNDHIPIIMDYSLFFTDENGK